jgi:biopolymer transport protein ExbB/TolQ
MTLLAHPWWIALVMVVVGFVFALVSPISPLLALRRLGARAESLQRAQLFIDAEQLQERMTDVERSVRRIGPLIARMASALALLQRSLQSLHRA